MIFLPNIIKITHNKININNNNCKSPKSFKEKKNNNQIKENHYDNNAIQCCVNKLCKNYRIPLKGVKLAEIKREQSFP